MGYARFASRFARIRPGMVVLLWALCGCGPLAGAPEEGAPAQQDAGTAPSSVLGAPSSPSSPGGPSTPAPPASPAKPPPPPPLATNSVTLSQTSTSHIVQSVSNGLVVDLVASDAGPNAKVDQWPVNYAANQLWGFAATSDANSLALRIVSTPTSCLAIDSSNNTTVVACTGDPSQQWFMQPVGDGNSYLLNRANNKCLTAGAAGSNGAILSVSPCAQSTAQRWALAETSKKDQLQFGLQFSNTDNRISAFSADFVVPAGLGDQNGVLFDVGAASRAVGSTYTIYSPFNLSWGSACGSAAPTPGKVAKWRAYSSYYTYQGDTCEPGTALEVDPNDVLHVDFSVTGSTGKTTITSKNTGKSVNFTHALAADTLQGIFIEYLHLAANPLNQLKVVAQNFSYTSNLMTMFDCRQQYMVPNTFMAPPAFTGHTCTSPRLDLIPCSASGSTASFCNTR